MVRFCSWKCFKAISSTKTNNDFRGSKCDTPHLLSTDIYLYIGKKFNKIYPKVEYIYIYNNSMEHTLTGTDVQMLPRNNAAVTESSIASFLRVAKVGQYENICIYIYIFVNMYV